jgi:hypothetical protein
MHYINLDDCNMTQNENGSAQHLMELADVQLQKLYETARYHADIFWDNHMGANKSGRDRAGSLGCRVRQKQNSIYIEWYHNIWHRKRQGGFTPISKYIRKPARSHGYNLESLFKYADPWEYPVIEQTEAAFAQIRRQNKNLAKIRRYLRDMHAAEEMLAELERTAAHV